MSHVCKECGSVQYAPVDVQGEHQLRSPQSVFELCRRMRGLKQEQFRVLALDVRLKLIRATTISVGSLTECLVHPREVFRFLIDSSAASAAMIHNHPSGYPAPSVQDQELTTRLQEVGELVGIKIIDHRLGAQHVEPKTGKPWKGSQWMFDRAITMAGMPDLWFHDLLRSFVTKARRQKIPESVIMRISGHLTHAVFERYNIVEEDDLHAAVKLLEVPPPPSNGGKSSKRGAAERESLHRKSDGGSGV
jgi:hypothetical protein